jgi:dihydropteroate synthase
MHPTQNSDLASKVAELDQKLSNRYIDLDPSGYLIIYLDREAGLICAKHYSNTINERGLACDPETGKPIPVRGKVERQPTTTYTGRSAKELCIELFEKTSPCPVTRLDHAAYLGREFVRAEIALVTEADYIQD